MRLEFGGLAYAAYCLRSSWYFVRDGTASYYLLCAGPRAVCAPGAMDGFALPLADTSRSLGSATSSQIFASVIIFWTYVLPVCACVDVGARSVRGGGVLRPCGGAPSADPRR